MVASNDTANDAQGVFFMVLSEALLCAVNAIVKFVGAWSAERIMAVRYTTDLLLCMILCAACGLSLPSPRIAARLLLRGMAYIAFVCFLWAGLRSCLPLGDVVVGIVAISPLFVVSLSWLFLGEEIPRMWPLQMVLCVTGALLVNKPLAPPAGCTVATTLLPVAAAFCGAMMNFASRTIKEVPPPVVMAFNDIVAVVFSFGYLAWQGHGESLGVEVLPDGINKSFYLVILSAVIGWLGLMSNVKGYQSVSFAGIAGIAGYVSVPFGYITQIVVFNEIPDALSIAGVSLILVTNITVAVSKYYTAKAEKDQDTERKKPLLDVSAQLEDAAKGA